MASDRLFPFTKTIANSDSTNFIPLIRATERMTVVEFGVFADDSNNVPGTTFAFKAVKRTGGNSANDLTVPAFTAAFAAEGGPGGDPSNQNFDNANQIPSGIVTNTAGL